MGRFMLGAALAVGLVSPAISAHATTILTFTPTIADLIGIHGLDRYDRAARVG